MSKTINPQTLVFQPTQLRRKSQNPRFVTKQLLLWFANEGFVTKQLWRKSPTVCGKQNDFYFCLSTTVLRIKNIIYTFKLFKNLIINNKNTKCMKITLSKLSTKDLATLTQRTINVSDSGTYPVITDHPLLAELKNKYAEYDAVYAKQIYSGKGDEVATADNERDTSFSNLKAFLNGYRKLSSVANHEAAEELYQIFKLFGLELYKMSYSSQTAQMKKLIEELEKPENSQKLKDLKLTAAFEDMKNRQTAFETVFAQQAGANADLRNQKSASGIRKDLEKTLKSFFGLLTAMKDVTDWQLFYNDVNELVKAAKNSDQQPIVNKEDNPKP